MIRNTSPSQSLNENEEIIQEAKKWTLENKGMECTKEHGCYASPRISSEIADCSMPMTFDHYSYCSLGCCYCFAYFFKSNNPGIKEVHLKHVDDKKMIAAMEGHPKDVAGRQFYDHFYSKEFLLHWGGLADPFCNFEKKNRVGLSIIKALGEMNYPTLFSFKGNGIFLPDYVKMFEKYAKQSNFAFQVSIVTNSDELSRLVEIGVPSTSKRLKAIKLLSDMGYYTILRLRPFIMGLSDIGLDELLHRALEAGINGVSVEWFAMDGRANEGMKTRYAWLQKLMGVPNLHEYYKSLSPNERGGYMRLNRLVKEPYVKQIYKFCVENDLVCGISDPDFKELNTSGSCCGMPDHFPKNRKLENWTRNQLTYHIKEARKKYHKSGQLIELQFNTVYRNDSWLTDNDMAKGHVAVIGKCSAERGNITQRDILQQHWNNLRSPGNPRNYFHGKLLPKRLDSRGNLIYVYNPLEYEDAWSEEGIDMSR